MFEWLNEDSIAFLKNGYLDEGEDAQQRARDIAEHAESILGEEGFADKFYEYMGRGWYSLSSPIWANFGKDRGLPISCFGSYVPDSMDGILRTSAEVGMMSKYGGGTSAYFGDVRERGAPITNNGNSEGTVHFMRLFDTVIDVSKQGSTRRGSFAAYLPIDHPDVEEFLTIKSDGSDIQNLFFAVTVEDEWMRSMIDGDSDKRRVWAKVLQARTEIGLPYIMFNGNANKLELKPDVYQSDTIRSSNLCSEIMLPVADDESFVCDLSSMNLLHWDDWKDTDAVAVLTRFLDAVMTEFIIKGEKIPFLERSVNFARRHRALGIGVLGWHSLLQSKMIPLESVEAMMLNNVIFKTIKDIAYNESELLAERYGEPERLKGYGRRNSTLMAIAPTTSSAFILGQVSQSIEPLKSNYYVRDLAKRKATFRNPYLKRVLTEKGQDTEEVWRDILNHDGSVQHLNFLTDHEKKVFKTFSEISQVDIIRQAGQRQRYIDQAQSLNLMVHPDTPTKDINALYIQAWEEGVKTLYYQHSINAAQAFNQDLLTCSACES